MPSKRPSHFFFFPCAYGGEVVASLIVTSVGRTLRVAVVGVGRIGVFHARHVQELSREGMGCELVAVVDRYGDTAERVAGGLQSEQKTPLAAFRSVDALLAANVADAAVVATRTEDHADDARALIDAGMRVLIEKPLAHPLDRARGLTAELNRDERWSRLKPLQVGRYAEYFARMEFTMLGFDVYGAEVDDRGIDFVIRRGAQTYYDVQVESVRGLNYMFFEKAKFEIRDNMLAAMVLFTQGKPLFSRVVPSWDA